MQLKPTKGSEAEREKNDFCPYLNDVKWDYYRTNINDKPYKNK